MTGSTPPSGSDINLTQRLDIDFALQAAGLGVWSFDPLTNRVTWDARCRQLFGLDTNLTYEEAFQLIHPEHRDRLDQAFKWTMNPASSGIYDEVFRTRHAQSGQLIWVRVVGKSQLNDAGDVAALTGIAIDVTESKRLETSEMRFRHLVEQAPVAMALVSGPQFIITLANEHVLDYWGRPRGAVMNRPFFEVMPTGFGQGFDELLTGVYTTGEPGVANERSVERSRNGRLEQTYIDLVCEPYREADGTITGVLVVASDSTGQVVARQQLARNEAHLQTIIKSLPSATVLFVGRELIVDMPSDVFIDVINRGPDVTGKPLGELMPELESQSFLQILDDVFTTGQLYRAFGTPVSIRQHDGSAHREFFDLIYTPLFDDQGNVYAILSVATNVTEVIKAQQQIQESEAKLRSLVDSAPFPIGVYVGQELRIQLANQSILDVWGKGNDVIGKLYKEILPELKNQAIFDQLAGVYATGIPYEAKNQRVDLVIDGHLQPYYFNYNFTPLFDATGQVDGVMNTAAEVTDLVLAKQKVDESEAILRGAIELAELGTWSYEPATGTTEFSERLRRWFGIAPDEIITPERGYRSIRPADRPRVEQATRHAVSPEGDGLYAVEYTLEAAQAGQERVIHAVGRLHLDEYGQPLKLVGTAQDVTRQRNIQLALEQQVRQRTEELAAANQELAAANEEMSATNEELSANNEEYAAINEELLVANQDTDRINDELMESTGLLMRSNENLQRFAYVASHDLQEPLRKIQQFGDLLKGRYADQLGDGVDYLERMQTAATRMSTLIRDLLDFSRIATQRDSNETVPLTEVVSAVVADLELTIQETSAEVFVDTLPNVSGDVSQLKQLFQNLLSNALKFHRTDPSGVPVPPRVQICADLIPATELPPDVRPARQASSYHRVDVVDNGIGFDEKYLDRIFQVFQRLHGKSEYAGTGIGLAICEKVVTNHGGAITANSQPGQGATFSIYLPDLLD